MFAVHCTRWQSSRCHRCAQQRYNRTHFPHQILQQTLQLPPIHFMQALEWLKHSKKANTAIPFPQGELHVVEREECTCWHRNRLATIFGNSTSWKSQPDVPLYWNCRDWVARNPSASTSVMSKVIDWNVHYITVLFIEIIGKEDL